MKQIALLLTLIGSVLSSGCGLKAPLVTEALPVTKVRGLSVSKKPSPQATPLATPTPSAAAPAPTAPAAAELSASAVQSSALTGTQTYYFPGGSKLPPLAKALQIETMTFRSLLADPTDQSEDARKNDALVDQCPGGRGNLDFIQSVAVGVRHPGEKDADAVLVATYTQTKTGLCGFRLTPTNFDMKDYASDYVFVIQVTGTLPPMGMSISGTIAPRSMKVFKLAPSAGKSERSSGL